MDEIAPLTVWAVSLLYIYPTLLGFILRVHFLVSPQLMGAMGELALILIRTKTTLYKPFA
jgi:hypothetical protein